MDSLLYILRIWTISISTVLGRPIRLENEWTGGAEGDIGNDLVLPRDDGWRSPGWS